MLGDSQHRASQQGRRGTCSSEPLIWGSLETCSAEPHLQGRLGTHSSEPHLWGSWGTCSADLGVDRAAAVAVASCLNAGGGHTALVHWLVRERRQC
eukprot:1160344-Pelagomonas_calceolata.AAC.8